MSNSREEHIRAIQEYGARSGRSKQSVRVRVASGGLGDSGKGASKGATPRKAASAKDSSKKTSSQKISSKKAASQKETSKKAASVKAASKNSTPNKAKGSSSRPIKSPSEREVDKPRQINWRRYTLPLGWIFISVGLIGLFSSVSYFYHWKNDFDLARWDMLFDSSAGLVDNAFGQVGSILGQLIVGDLFGCFGLILPSLVVLCGVALVRRSPIVGLFRYVVGGLLIMALGSLALGHFSGADVEVFGSGWGGLCGIYMAQWLSMVIGEQGTTLLLLLLVLAVGYYVFEEPVSRLSRGLGLFYRDYCERRRLRNLQRRQLVEQRTLEVMRQRRELQERLGEERRLHREMGLAGTEVDDEIVAGTEIELCAGTFAGTEAGTLAGTEIELCAGTLTGTEAGTLAGTDDTLVHLETIELDNGQYGAVVGCDSDGTASFIYFDREAFLSQNISALHSTAEVELAEEVQPEEEEDPFEIIEIAPTPTVAAQQETQQESQQESQQETQQESQQESQQETQQEPRINIHYAHTQEPEEPPTEEVVIEEIPTEESLEDRQIDQLELYDPTLELRNYTKPPVELLKDHTRNIIVTKEELLDNKNKIVHTLETFGIRIDSIDVVVGPTITLYEIVPAPGIRISKIKNLEDDIAMALSALGIRIIAPMPGRGTIGIEVPNKQKNVVSMYSVIKSTRFQQSEAALPIALGKTIQDETFVIDLAKMPHLLVAGATGQGKSVGLNAIITSLIYKKHPSELKFVLVDPKKVELTLYAKLENHFLAKIPDADEAIITDNQKVIYTLNSLCIEMEERYQLLKEARVRNFKEYNDKFTHRRLNPEKGHRFLPYLVVIIDEFADLIMTSGREIETPIARIAQLARAVGIHLIIATQRPTTNIITGVIKANFPARIAFRVTSQIDSRTILDQTGANQLVGQGDMLVSANNEVTRVQCAFVDTPEVEMIVDHIADQLGYDSPLELPDYQPDSSESSSREDRGSSSGKRDPLFAEVAHYVVANQSGSASTIQRKFSIGFNRAGRIVDQLEDAGIVGSAQGSKPRQVLITDPMAIEDIIGYD